MSNKAGGYLSSKLLLKETDLKSSQALPNIALKDAKFWNKTLLQLFYFKPLIV